MHCPNCDHNKLHTVETYQTPTKTVRTKKCMACDWRFTSVEEISDMVTIPKEIRLRSRKEDPNEIRKRRIKNPYNVQNTTKETS